MIWLINIRLRLNIKLFHLNNLGITVANVFGIFPVDLKTWNFSWNSFKSFYALLNVVGGLTMVCSSCVEQMMTKPTSTKVCKIITKIKYSFIVSVSRAIIFSTSLQFTMFSFLCILYLAFVSSFLQESGATSSAPGCTSKISSMKCKSTI